MWFCNNIFTYSIDKFISLRIGYAAKEPIDGSMVALLSISGTGDVFAMYNFIYESHHVVLHHHLLINKPSHLRPKIKLIFMVKGKVLLWYSVVKLYTLVYVPTLDFIVLVFR